MQIKLGVLGDDDEIFDIYDNRLVLKRKNGQIEVIDFIFDEEGIPRIQPISIILSFKINEQAERLESEYYLLDEGDEVFKVCYDKLYMKKKNKEVEIFSIVTQSDGCSLAENSIIITFGNKVVSVKKPGTDIEIGTF